MKISVVTVCRNSASTIGHTMESLLRQTHGDREFLIVDGASTDDTLSIVRSFQSPDVRIISQPDCGIYDAMNTGLRMFSGDAVGFLNSDDAFHDNQVLTRITESLEDSDIVYGDLDMIDNCQSRRLIRQWRAGEYRAGSYQLGWMPPHATFYARRHVIVQIGEFDLKYAIAADYDLMLRAMALNNFRISYIPNVLVDFTMGGLSTKSWTQTARINIECLRSRRAHLSAAPIDAAFFLRPLRRLFQLRSLTHYLFRRV